MGSHYKIRTGKTGHYYMHGTLIETTRYVWICFHGYGQLAKYFIQKFEFLDKAKHCVIVPEGLNRFYFEGANERPLANWMTREDRLDEIADYVEYIEALRKKLSWDKNPDIKVIYLGFSQGVTTLLRWMTNLHPRADYLLMWAGSVPDDILPDPHRDFFNSIPAHFFVGDRDPYIKEERKNVLIELMDQIGMKAEIHSFQGEHKADEATLQQWVKTYLPD